MPQSILIMGLPGSGKTYLAQTLMHCLRRLQHTVTWYNADQVRRDFDDWDFSLEGRMRQSHRMRELAQSATTDFVICDFVAPLAEMRDNFQAHWTVWVDTIDAGRFEDTNKMFRPPDSYDFRITEQDSERWAGFIADHVSQQRRRPVFDWKAPTVEQLGRWQPWHAGHRALFERLIQRTGQVCIMIRDCQGWQDSNPFAIDQVKNAIKRDLDPLYQGQYEILVVPNIIHIGYGRGVGYTIEEEKFDESITSISGTAIRKSMGLE